MKRIIMIVMIMIVMIMITNYIVAQNITRNFPGDYTKKDLQILENRDWSSTFSGSNNFFSECDNTIKVREQSPSTDTRMTSIRTEFGLLFGVNDGEWSGGFYHKAKGNAPRLLKDGNVKFLYKNNKDEILYFYSKNAPTTWKLEQIYKDTVNIAFETKEITTLPDYPAAIVYNDTNLIVAGLKNVYIYENGTFKPVFKNNEWRNVEPISMLLLDSEHVLIGLYKGIVKVNLKTCKMELFVLERMKVQL